MVLYFQDFLMIVNIFIKDCKVNKINILHVREPLYFDKDIRIFWFLNMRKFIGNKSV